MDKAKLCTLCETLADLELQINDLGLKLQCLSGQLKDVKNGILEVIEEGQKWQGEVKMVITEVYGNVESSEDKQKTADPEKNSQESEANVDASIGAPVEIRYCSMALSNDFEFSDTELTRSIRSIYVIEVMNDTEARFYPIAEKAQHFLMRREELVDPVCITGKDLDLGDFCITEDKYGLLKRNAYGRWDIVKKCSLI